MKLSHFSRFFLFFSAGLFSFTGVHSQQYRFGDLTRSSSAAEQRWVDSVFASLTPEERWGQLFMAAAYSNRGPEHTDHLLQLVREQHIGGLIFFQGTPRRQVALTNYLQSQAKVPLLIAIDGEWGLGMRLEDTQSFPYQMTLGAVQDDSLLYAMGAEVARQLRRIGVQMNFAPVADINNNPRNPVINYRSFGSDREEVMRRSLLYMRGMQDHGILATAKHFPGHGDTDTDSHLGLPVIRHSRAHLDSLELYPFRRLIDAGVAAVMVAHLNIPALDSTPRLPSTLSRPIVTGLLKEQLGFRGLVVTDAMNMKGVTKYYAPGEADVKALEAGNDLIEFSEDIPRALAAVERAIRQGRLDRRDLEERVKKVLRAKYRAGLARWRPVPLDHLDEDLHTLQGERLIRRLSQEAVTLLHDPAGLVPIRHLERQRIAAVVTGSDTLTRFQEYLQLYTHVEPYLMPADSATRAALLDRLAGYTLVILGIQGMNQRPYRRFGLTDAEIAFVERLVARVPTITVLFGNPYALTLLPALRGEGAVLVTYRQTPVMEELAAQMVFGAYGLRGRLPVDVGKAWPAGTGLTVAANGRLRYDRPESVGVDGAFLQRKIDSLVALALAARATPGCEVLVARHGTVIFHKTYGYYTYARKIPVSKGSLYDLASVTKVTGPLPALMRLHDQGKFDLDVPLCTYWPDWRHSNKKELVIRDILAHQARLQAWIPYWRSTVNRHGELRRVWYSLDSTGKHHTWVAPRIFLKDPYRKKIYKAIRKSPLLPEKKYLYSGLSFYIWPAIIEKMTGMDYETYLKDSIYRPLGAWDITYNPHLHYPLARIVPTENDTFFRKEQLWGWVHDEGAAMMGGVSGNAGLFATANDLAKVMQMYMNMGRYGGRRIIGDTTLREFTRWQFPENGNRRGLGFDKPYPDNASRPPGKVYPCPSAGPNSFGHSGYTGTFVWADPDEELVYVFLSNRVYPTRLNTKLYKMNIRTDILEAIYQAAHRREGKSDEAMKR